MRLFFVTKTDYATQVCLTYKFYLSDFSGRHKSQLIANHSLYSSELQSVLCMFGHHRAIRCVSVK